jgi:RHS repeat-associated protein
MTYDPDWNKVATVEDGRGNVTTYTYDGTTGDLLTTEFPEINSTVPTITFTYNGRGQVLTKTDQEGMVTLFAYDSTTERLLSETVDHGTGKLNLLTEYDHDAVGNVTEATDPRGNTTLYEWDDMRRLKKIIAPEPFEYETKFTYDENGNQTKAEVFAGLDGMSQPIWQTTQWTYTANNQVATIIDPASHTTEFTYNSLRKLWKREDAAGRVTEFLYDELGRLVTTIDPASVVSETRTYTDNGALASLEDANENVTEFEYDGFDRLKKRIFPDSTFEQFTRDANGNVTVKLTRAGDTINFTWDVLNRLTSNDPDNQPTVSYDYDLTNRLLHVSKPVVSGDPSSGEIEYTWDAAGRLLMEEYPDGKQVQYEVDENGNVTRLTYPDSYYVERYFDELNRLTGVKLNGAGSNAVDIDYDPLSRRSDLTYSNGTTSEYGFTALNKLMTSLEHTFNGSSVDFGYGYNNVDELTNQSVDDNAYLWHPSSASTIPYDAANELNQYPEVNNVAYSYNDNGCLTDDGVWEFGYDTENRLVTADDGVTSAAYLYDPLNRQAQKEVNSTKTRFVYSGWQRIADYDGSNNLIARYVYGVGLDEPLIKVAAGGGLTFMHHDHMGSVVALSDNTGAVTNVYKYTPWGESPSMSGTTFGFTGQRFDAETNLYYYKNRYYSPKLGRFLQPDPILYEGGDLNLYAYVNNAPLNFTDPFGLEAKKKAEEEYQKKLKEWEKNKKEWEESIKNNPNIPKDGMFQGCQGGGACATEGEHELKYPVPKPTPPK